MPQRRAKRVEAGLRKGTATRMLTSIAVAAGGTAIAGLVFGPIGGVAAAVAAILWAAWRHDNDLGTCLPLAVLVLLVIGMLALLMFLTAIDRPR